MKKVKALIHICESQIQERWQKLSKGKKRRTIVLFFAGYLLITICVIAKVWFDAKAETNWRKNEIEHISNPLIQSQKKLGIHHQSF